MKILNYTSVQILLLLSLIEIYTSQATCNDSNCSNGYGECIDNQCLCAAGYTTIEGISNRADSLDFKYCNYVYKYKDTALMYELVLPFGMGHLYALRYQNFLLKFLIFWYLSLSKVLFKKRIKLYSVLEKVDYFISFLFAFLYVADYFGFTFNYYADGNGMPLI